MERPGVVNADRRVAGAVAQRPGSAAQTLIHLSRTVTALPRVPPRDLNPRRQSDCAPRSPRCLISIKPGRSPLDRIGAEEIVLLAVFADIHANRQAFVACLDYARG